jgi:hypothetical protein
MFVLCFSVIQKNSAELESCYAELASKEKLIMDSHSRESKMRGLLASSKKKTFRPTHSARARSLVDRALSFDVPPKEVDLGSLTEDDVVARAVDDDVDM